MRCPECVRLGLTSRFNEFRAEPKKGGVERYADEGGTRHIHDHTVYKTVFSCTNGHSWLIEAESRCPHRACEWNERPLVLAGEKQPGEA